MKLLSFLRSDISPCAILLLAESSASDQHQELTSQSRRVSIRKLTWCSQLTVSVHPQTTCCKDRCCHSAARNQSRFWRCYEVLTVLIISGSWLWWVRLLAWRYWLNFGSAMRKTKSSDGAASFWSCKGQDLPVSLWCSIAVSRNGRSRCQSSTAPGCIWL